MEEGRIWAAMLREQAERNALEMARLKSELERMSVRAKLAEERLIQMHYKVQQLEDEKKRKREAADNVYRTVSVATDNMFGDHGLVTQRAKLEIMGHIRDQHDQWHALFI
jgi:hypothetical protein